jgi:deoxyribodipyrimidine photo-lyase
MMIPFSPKWHPDSKLVNMEINPKRLKRFSRYWEKVGPVLLGDGEYRQP